MICFSLFIVALKKKTCLSKENFILFQASKAETHQFVVVLVSVVLLVVMVLVVVHRRERERAREGVVSYYYYSTTISHRRSAPTFDACFSENQRITMLMMIYV